MFPSPSQAIQTLRSALPGGGALPGLALRDGFGTGMTAMVMQNAGRTFPGVDFRPFGGPPPSAGLGAPPMPASTGTGVQITAAGQPLAVPTPPVPFTPAVPLGAASAPVAPGPFAPGATESGSPVSMIVHGVRPLVAPSPAPIAAAPGMPSSSGMPGAAAGMPTAIPQAATVPVPVRPSAGAVPAAVVSQAAPAQAAMTSPPSMPMVPAAGPAAGTPAGAPQAVSAAPVSAPPPPASVPQSAMAAQTPSPSANTLQVPLPPPRADVPMQSSPAAMPRGDAPAQASPPALPVAVSLPAGATLLAAVPLAAALQAPTAQPVAGHPQISGHPQAVSPVVGDMSGSSRVELTGPGVYTADGPGLRRRLRLEAGPQALGSWMLALAQCRLLLVRPHDDVPREVARAMQWVFWTLALVAYGCLALVLAAFLLSTGDSAVGPAMRSVTGELALAGLVAATGAWWLARRLAGSRPGTRSRH